jgi:hypothetical protein
VAEQQAQFRDFTRKRSPIYFTVGDDRFDCVKALAPVKLQEFVNASRRGATDETNAIDRVVNAMRFIVVQDQFPRFLELLSDDDDPIDIEQLMEIMSWAVETYGVRPTGASSNSSTTSANDGAGTSSTAGAPAEESIPSP